MIRFGKYHGRHYFGGVAFVLLALQLLTGTFLAFFYSPHLKEAYASIQYLYNQLTWMALFRDAHRWIAAFLVAAVVVHALRSLLRRDFNNPGGKVLWVTGSLLLLPLLALLASGFILPWEWRGYWFMEMIPNYFGFVPVIGPSIKSFLIDAFTLNRTLMLHVVLLPFFTLILLEYHVFSKVRKRAGGLLAYLGRHALLTLPFLVAIAVLMVYLPMPTQDPDIIPMPLEGADIPSAEWFLLVFWLPFLHYTGATAPLLALLLPMAIFVLLTLLPFFLKQKPEEPGQEKIVLNVPVRRVLTFSSVLFSVSLLFGLMFLGNHRSPTMGCNSCHNVYMGTRMGIPPDAFKDRNVVPRLADDAWMVKHWFFPQHVW